MKDSNTFQLVTIIVFVAFGVLGLLVFSGIIKIGGSNDEPEQTLRGNITIWGTLPEKIMRTSIKGYFRDLKNVNIRYVERRESVFDRELVEALASGIGPDLILLPQNLVARHEDKIFPIPYESMSRRDFRDTFIEEGELYLTDKGILALPLMVDPMVMYWNRDIFSSSGIVSPPEFWDELFALSEEITEKDEANNILKSTVALGEYSNISNARELVSALLLQSGNPIIIRDGNTSKVVLGSKLGLDLNPANQVLSFYTDFANPVKAHYSWNRALPLSQDMFITGDLAIYFGFVSEKNEIERRNPRLNMDIAPIPQRRGEKTRVTFGDMRGIAILKSSGNFDAAFFVATSLVKKDFLTLILGQIDLPPARRDMLKEAPSDVYSPIFYSAALISKGWLDPNPTESGRIFRDMIEDVTSGRSVVRKAVEDADGRLKALMYR